MKNKEREVGENRMHLCVCRKRKKEATIATSFKRENV